VRVLREHGVDQREHHLPLTLAGVRKRRAQKMHARNAMHQSNHPEKC
jgi:hypothetical protein